MYNLLFILWILPTHSFRLVLNSTINSDSSEKKDSVLYPHYYISLNISEQFFKFGLDFSSGSSFLFSSSCNCTNSSKYIENLPKALQLPKKGLEYKSIQYKNSVLTGVYYPLNFSVKSSEYTNKFLVVKQSSELLNGFSLDGVIGLGFLENSDDQITFTEQLGENFRVTNFGVVVESEYNNSIESSIEFGHGSIQYYFQGKKRTKNLIEETPTWDLLTTRFIIQKSEVESDYFSEFDLNHAKIKVPKTIFPQVHQTLSTYYENLNNSLEFPCKESEIMNFSSITFMIQRSKFPIRAKNFIEYNNGTCKMLIEENAEDKWIFGEPFFRDYFISFGYDNKDVTFYQIDEFKLGYYESGIIGFVVLMFFVSGCFAWILTGKNESGKKIVVKRDGIEEPLISGKKEH